MNRRQLLRRVVCISRVILVLTACGGRQEERTQLFDYDQDAPLGVQESSVSDRDGIKVHDISYASPKGGRRTAYLVVPPGDGPFAGVVFLHWGGGNRRDFLDEAVLLAKSGVVSMLIDAPWRPDHADDEYVQLITDLRRAVDLLVSRPDVETNHLGYVGHSLGATWGGVLAGVEKRVKAYVLMAGVPRLSESDMPGGKVTSASLDAIHYVGHAAPSALFFQFATQDAFVAREAALEYYEAGTEPKLIKWYETTHAFNDQARVDRFEWLSAQLELERTP